MTSDKQRILVIGTGSIGTRHLRILHGMGHPVAGCDVEEAAFSAIREDIPDLETFTDMDKALASKPDLVVVATAHHLHAPHTLAAMEAGAHVLCEKPMADTLEAADAMMAAAKRTGKTLHIGFMNRYHPIVVQARELVASGRLGLPLSASADLGSYITLECSRARHQAKMFAALLLDYTHQLDFVPYVLDAPATRVYAIARNRGRFDLKSDPNTIAMMLEHGDGPISEIHLDYCRKPQVTTLKVTGDEAAIECDMMGYTLRLRDRKGGVIEEKRCEPQGDELYRTSFRNFLAAIDGKESNYIPGSEGRKSLEIVTAVLKSIETRQPVNIERG